MHDARSTVPGPPGQPPSGPPPAPPPMPRRARAIARHATRSASPRARVAAIGLLLATGSLAPAAARSGTADEPSAGLLLRRARYALAEGDVERARASLRAACTSEPSTGRGLEAALLLASLEFGRGDRTAAESALAMPAGLARSLPAAADALALARGWIALGSDDPASARLAFAAAAASPDASARDLSALGSAWASLAAGEPASAIATLGPVSRASTDPVLRTAARWSLARAHAAAGDSRRARHALRDLRRTARSTSFADDVELDLALAELASGDLRSARRTILRLGGLPGSSSGPARRPGEVPTLADLQLPPRRFVARLAALFTARPIEAESPVEFLRRALDRDARSDATEALRLVSAAEGGRP